MCPGGSGRAGEGRLQVRRRDGDTEAVRADEPCAVGAHEREQRVLALDALAARLGEARGDDTERAHAGGERGLGRIEHARARHADHRQVDGAVDLGDRAESLHAGDGRAALVHRVGRPLEATAHDVAEQVSSDRTLARRRADHGHAARPEERAQRRGDRDVVALGNPRAQALGGGDREAQLDLAAFDSALDLVAGGREDGEHAGVLGQHLGDEARDPGLARAERELLEQARADPAALLGVGDGERDLGGRGVAQARVARERHDRRRAVGPRERADERAALVPVRIEERLDEAGLHAAGAVEAQVVAAVGEPREELDERVGVVGRRRAQSQRAAVLQDHVHRRAHSRSRLCQPFPPVIVRARSR